MTEYMRSSQPTFRSSSRQYVLREKKEDLTIEQVAARLNNPTTSLGSGVQLSCSERLKGMYVIGASGTGKSTLLENLIMQDIRQGLGVCLIDPHGDLTRKVLSRIPMRRERDIILLNLEDYMYPFGLNLFDCADPGNVLEVEYTKSFVLHIFHKLLGAGVETTRLNQVLRHVTYTIIANPGMTFLEIPLLLEDKTVRGNLTANVTNPQVRLFWERYENLPARERYTLIESTLNRVDAFATSPLLQPIVGQAKTTINFRKVMDDGKILLVQLPPRLEESANLIGAVIIGKLLDAAYARKDVPEENRRQFHIYADEFQRFAIEDFATFFYEARKFKIGLAVAHQSREQLDDANRAATLQAGTMIAFRVTPVDAPELAGKFDITPAPASVELIEKESVEILRDPRVKILRPASVRIIKDLEMKEYEVTDGMEPVLTTVQNPFDHLIREGHSYPEVVKHIDILLDLAQAIEIAQEEAEQAGLEIQQVRHERVYTQTFDETEYVATHEQLLHGKHLINRLLADFNQGASYGSYEMGQRLKEIALTLRGFICFAQGAVWEKERGYSISGYPASMAEWKEIMLDEETSVYLPGLIETVIREVVERYEDRTALSLVGRDTANEFAQARYNFHIERRELAPISIKPTIPRNPFSLAQAETERLYNFLTSIATLCLALSSQQILAPSGQYQERRRTQLYQDPRITVTDPELTLTYPELTLTHPRQEIHHPQRTYQDMQNEVASGLARSLDYTAKVKTSSGEYTTITEKPETGMGAAALQKRRDRIRQCNLEQEYIRPRNKVEAEIAKRQGNLEKREKDQPPPRRSSIEG